MPGDEKLEGRKQVGLVGITNIPLCRTKCRECGKPFNTSSTGREYCLTCRPLPIECD